MSVAYFQFNRSRPPVVSVKSVSGCMQAMIDHLAPLAQHMIQRISRALSSFTHLPISSRKFALDKHFHVWVESWPYCCSTMRLSFSGGFLPTFLPSLITCNRTPEHPHKTRSRSPYRCLDRLCDSAGASFAHINWKKERAIKGWVRSFNRQRIRIDRSVHRLKSPIVACK